MYFVCTIVGVQKREKDRQSKLHLHGMWMSNELYWVFRFVSSTIIIETECILCEGI